MKVEIISKDKLLIYINNIFFKDENLKDKEKIIKWVKNYIIKLKNNYNINIRGFYKVRVFPNKKVGTFVEMEKLDEDDYDNIELRIIVDYKERLFFKFNDYFDIPNNCKYIYYDNFYYVEIENIKDNILNFIEMGEIVCEKNISEIFYKGKRRKKNI